MIKILFFLAAILVSQGAIIALIRSTQPECPSSGYSLIPHEYDCTKFYFCRDGVKDSNPTSCSGSSNHFSVAIGTCVHHSKADCALLGYPTEALTTESATEETTQAPGQPGQSVCPSSGYRLIAHEYDCTKFYFCRNGVRDANPTTCSGSSNHFSVSIGSCVHHSQANCNLPGYPTEALTTESATEATTQAPGQPAQSVCPSSGYTLIAHEYDCTKFYFCRNGVRDANPTTCSGSSNHFSVAIGTCVHHSQANCALSGYPTEALTTESATEAATQAPAQPGQSVCPSSGYRLIAHEYDCTKFYFCRNGVRDANPTTCSGSSNHFSVSIGSCVHHSQANCNLPGYPTEAITTESATEETTQAPGQPVQSVCPSSGYRLIAHEYDCTKFYFCRNGVRDANPTTCSGSSNHFSVAIGTCVHHSQANCNLPGYPTEALTTESTTESTTQAPAQVTEGTTQAPAQPGQSVCPSSGYILIAHEYDCTKFYFCRNGVRDTNPTTCSGSSNHFSVAIGTCVHHSKANCNLPGYPPEASTTESGADATTQAPAQVTEGTTQAPAQPGQSVCPSSGYTLIAHEYDCTKFYFCRNGVRDANPTTCSGSSNHFSVAIGTCVHHSKANCNLPGYPTEAPTTESATEATTQAPTQVTEGTTQAQAQPGQSVCPSSGYMLIAHEYDCTKFYFCRNGVRDASPTTCSGSSNHFSVAIGTCVHHSKANCNLPGYPPEASTTESGAGATTQAPVQVTEGTTQAPAQPGQSVCPSSGYMLIAHEYICTKFYFCRNGVRDANPTTCSGSSNHFSVAIGTCVHHSKANCNLTGYPTEAPTTESATEATTQAPAQVTEGTTQAPAQPGQSVCPSSGYMLIAHEYDCTKFYFCRNGVRDANPTTCSGSSNHFSVAIGTCVHHSKANCNLPGYPPEASTTESGADATTQAPAQVTEGTTQAPAQPGQSVCPSSGYMLIAHEYDCTKFYFCRNGVRDANPTTCSGSSNHFSVAIGTCVHHSKANCNLPGYPPEASTTESGADATTQAPVQVTEGTTQAPAQPGQSVCPSSGYMLIAHEYDCTKFYFCRNGVRDANPTTCSGSSNHFSVAIGTCVHHSKANCNLPGYPTEASTTESVADATTQAPAQVTEGTTQAPAQPGQSTCVHHSKANCNLPGYPTEAPTTESATEATTQAPAQVTEGTTQAPAQPGQSVCPSSGYMLIAHEYDCTKFYFCRNGVRDANPTTCSGSSNHFSVAIGTCVHHSKANCNLPGYPPESSTTKSGADATTQAPAQVTEGTTQAPAQPGQSVCPSSGYMLIAHEYDCTKFYFCRNGVRDATPTTCSGSSNHFSVAIGTCVHHSKANCNLPGYPPEASTTESGADATTQAPAQVTEGTTQAPAQPGQSVCPSSGYMLIAHEYDCTKFYFCRNGVRDANPTTCSGSSNHFSVAIGTCVHHSKANCNLPGYPPEASTTESGGDATTQAPAQVTEGTTQAPAQPGQSVCPSSGYMLIAHEYDCTKFYFCRNGVRDANPTTCSGSSNHFSVAIGTCVHHSKANCNLPGYPPEASTTESGADATTQAPAQVTEGTTQAPAQPGQSVCPSSGYRLIAHEYDCTKFYFCRNGVRDANPTTCSGSSNHFSVAIGTCVHHSKANCNLPGHPTEAPTTESATDATTQAPAQPGQSVCPSSGYMLIAHEYDCTKFYFCRNGVRDANPTDCSGSSNHFSVAIGTCVHYSKANCNLPGYPPEASTTESGADATTQAPAQVTEGTTQAPAQPGQSVCPSSGYMLIAHEYDCTKFYFCRNGVRDANPTTCSGSSNHFSVAIGTCVHHSKANCNLPGYPTEAPTTESATEATTQAPAQVTEGTTQAPAQPGQSVCPSSGYMLIAHEYDCTKFYFCRNGVRDANPTTCSGSSNHFSVAIGTCVHHSKANCNLPGYPTEASTTESGTDTTTQAPAQVTEGTTQAPAQPGQSVCPSSGYMLIAHEYDCTKFYFCRNGVRDANPTTCSGSSNHFSVAIGTCVHHSKANCNLPGYPTEAPTTESATEATTQAPAQVTEGTTQAPAQPGQSVCPSSGYMLIAHEYDCTKFYFCRNGVRDANPTTCSGSSNHFSVAIGTCVHHSKANCNLPGYPPEPSTTESGTDATTQAPAQVTEGTTQAPAQPGQSVCPSSGYMLIAHEYDCTKFYFCRNGVRDANPTTCSGSSNHFSVAIGTCVHHSKANCNLPGYPPEASTTESGAGATTQAPVQVTEGTTQAPAQPGQSVCPSSGYMLIAHEYDCTKFYFCRNGVRDANPTTCSGSSNHFSVAIGTCVHHSKANCNLPGYPTEASTTESGGDATTQAPAQVTEGTTQAPAQPGQSVCPSSGYMLIAHEYDCTKFYFCRNGVRDANPTTCSGSSNHFSVAIGTCVHHSKANCNLPGYPTEASTTESGVDATTQAPAQVTEGTTQAPAQPGQSVCPSSGYMLIAHEYDCTKFYFCRNGVRDTNPTTCSGSSNHFSVAIGTCVHHSKANCNLPGYPPEASTTESATEATTQAPAQVTEGTTQAPAQPGQSVCPSSGYMLIAHEYDCTKFYFCRNGVRDANPTTCSGSSNHFSVAIGTCVHHSKANCNLPGYPPEASTTESGADATTQAPAQVTEGTTQAPAQPGQSVCPSSGYMLIAHEYDCTKFYFCRNGIRDVNPTTCSGSSNHFSVAIGTCVHYSKANCNLPGYPTEASTTESGADATTQAPAQVTEGTTQAPAQPGQAVCPSSGYMLIAHEYDCTKFYFCRNGVRDANPTTCSGSSNHFSVAIGTCVHHSKANCNLPGYPPEASTTESATEATTQAPAQVTEGTTQAPAQPGQSVCPSSGYMLIAHEYDCTKFYFCRNGIRDANPTTCSGSSNHFSVSIGTCVHHSKANCNLPGYPPDASTTESATEATTQAPAQVTEGTTQAPAQPGQSVCPSSGYMLIAHEYDCSKFYFCRNGVRDANPTTCSGSSNHFSVTIGTCVHHSKANCNLPGYPPEASTTESGADATTQAPAQVTEGTTQASAQPGQSVCPSSGYRLIAHEYDCTKFYFCRNGVRDTNPTSCSGSNNHFSVAIGTCVHFSKADCNLPGYPTEAPATESGTEATTQAPAQPGQSVCPSSGYRLIAHEYDCTKFYFCRNGIRDTNPTSCSGSNNHFSVAIGTCVHYSKADCTLPGYPTEAPATEGGTEITTQTPAEVPEATTQTPVEITEPTTQTPSEVTEVTSQTPADVTEATTQTPIEVTEPTTQNPVEVTEPTTQTPAEVTEATTQSPAEVPEATTQTPVEITEPTTQTPSEVTEVTTQTPADVTEATTQTPVEMTEPTTQTSADVTEATTQSPSEVTEVTTQTPSDVTEATTQTPTEETELTTQTLVEEETEATTQTPVEVTEATTQTPVEETEATTQTYAEETEPTTQTPSEATEVTTETPADVTEANTQTPVDVTEPTTQNPVEVTEPTTQAPGEPGQSVCPSSGFALIPHEYDCSKFYFCVDGERDYFPSSCQGGNNHFSAATGTCVHYSEAGCTLSGYPTEAPETEGETEATTQAPGQPDESVCPSSGFTLIPHEYDCTKFYFCVEGDKDPFPSSCHGNTHFSVTTETCVHYSEAGCTLPAYPTEAPATEGEPEVTTQAPAEVTEATTQAPGETGQSVCPSFGFTLIPHEYDCTKFYFCVSGEKDPIPNICLGDNNHFSATTGSCVHYSEAGCTLPGYPTEAPAIEGETEATTQAPSEVTEATTQAPAAVTEATTQAPGEPGQSFCPSFGFTLIPHEYDCTKFYFCVSGEKDPIPNICLGDNNHFSATTGSCVHYSEAGCTLPGYTTEAPATEGEPEVTTQAPPEVTEATTLAPGETGQSVCPSFGFTLIPHEYDCTKFYFCVSGEKDPTPNICLGDNNHFSATTGSCVHYSESGCTLPGYPTEVPATESGTEATTQAPAEVTDAQTPDEPGQSVCPSYGFTLIPHEYDCTKFYFCVSGEKDAIPNTCYGSNNHFSVATGTCVHYSEADCTLPGYPPEAVGTTEAPIQPIKPDAVIEIAPDTPTTSTEATALPTVGPVQPSQPSIAVEVAPAAPAPSSEASDEDFFENGCPINSGLHVLLPHETSCGKFYQCVHGEKVLSSCAPGTVFNPDKQDCVHPSGIDRICDDETIDNVNTEEATQESGDRVELLPNGCPINPSIPLHLPHKTDCGKYYQCNFGLLIEIPCAVGTHFNPALQICDHPANAGCTLQEDNARTAEEQPSDPSEAIIAPKAFDFHISNLFKMLGVY